MYGKVSELCLFGDKGFEKSAFPSLKLLEVLKGTAVYTPIEFVGLVLNICVLSNPIVAKAVVSEMEIIVDASCIASVDSQIHEMALDVKESFQIAVIHR